ncbi:extracellular solute-binding protein [Patescibacteria group bacterium]|jgi:ABC-type glycerol-3-phosphate transport system substrate-binding protein|nr:extracellular solute-binding protein [Patescibacteria group bacterium]
MDLNNRDIFQYVLIGFFITMAVVAVILFSTVRNQGPTDEEGNVLLPVTIWGYFPEEVMRIVLDRPDLEHVTYVEFSRADFYSSLLEAIAVGSPPDLVMVDQGTLRRFQDKLYQIPWESYPQQTFRRNFVESAEVFSDQTGIWALPLSTDPMVMFWNRDIFANSGLVEPPSYWGEVVDLTEVLNDIDDDQTINKSTVAFGEMRNVRNAKEVLSTLLLQSGVPITTQIGGTFEGELRYLRDDADEPPAHTVLRFYTDFADPTRRVFSWDRARPSDRDVFIANDLALYFGYLTEYSTILNLNPTLNFDMALMPQPRGTDRRTTYARVTGLAIPAASQNRAGAWWVARRFTAPDIQGELGGETGRAPVLRSVLAEPQSTVYWSTAFDSAIIGRTWLDPNPGASYRSFLSMVESVQSGRQSISQAVREAERELTNMGQ